MTDTDACGYADTTTDHACRNDAGENGRCWIPSHNPEGGENPHGRPTKLSLERQEKIAGAIEAGKSFNSASRMAGVDPSTVYGWLDRGESEIQAGRDNEFTDFYKRLTRAKGHGEDFYFNLALEFARENEDHRFIASLMKQRYPDSWGDTETGVDAAEITVTSEVVEVTETNDSWTTSS